MYSHSSHSYNREDKPLEIHDEETKPTTTKPPTRLQKLIAKISPSKPKGNTSSDRVAQPTTGSEQQKTSLAQTFLNLFKRQKESKPPQTESDFEPNFLEPKDLDIHEEPTHHTLTKGEKKELQRAEKAKEKEQAKNLKQLKTEQKETEKTLNAIIAKTNKEEKKYSIVYELAKSANLNLDTEEGRDGVITKFVGLENFEFHRRFNDPTADKEKLITDLKRSIETHKELAKFADKKNKFYSKYVKREQKKLEDLLKKAQAVGGEKIPEKPSLKSRIKLPKIEMKLPKISLPSFSKSSKNVALSEKTESIEKVKAPKASLTSRMSSIFKKTPKESEPVEAEEEVSEIEEEDLISPAQLTQLSPEQRFEQIKPTIEKEYNQLEQKLLEGKWESDETVAARTNNKRTIGDETWVNRRIEILKRENPAASEFSVAVEEPFRQLPEVQDFFSTMEAKYSTLVDLHHMSAYKKDNSQDSKAILNNLEKYTQLARQNPNTPIFEKCRKEYFKLAENFNLPIPEQEENIEQTTQKQSKSSSPLTKIGKLFSSDSSVQASVSAKQVEQPTPESRNLKERFKQGFANLFNNLNFSREEEEIELEDIRAPATQYPWEEDFIRTLTKDQQKIFKEFQDWENKPVSIDKRLPDITSIKSQERLHFLEVSLKYDLAKLQHKKILSSSDLKWIDTRIKQIKDTDQLDLQYLVEDFEKFKSELKETHKNLKPPEKSLHETIEKPSLDESQKLTQGKEILEAMDTILKRNEEADQAYQKAHSKIQKKLEANWKTPDSLKQFQSTLNILLKASDQISEEKDKPSLKEAVAKFGQTDRAKISFNEDPALKKQYEELKEKVGITSTEALQKEVPPKGLVREQTKEQVEGFTAQFPKRAAYYKPKSPQTEGLSKPIADTKPEELKSSKPLNVSKTEKEIEIAINDYLAQAVKAFSDWQTNKDLTRDILKRAQNRFPSDQLNPSQLEAFHEHSAEIEKQLETVKQTDPEDDLKEMQTKLMEALKDKFPTYPLNEQEIITKSTTLLNSLNAEKKREAQSAMNEVASYKLNDEETSIREAVRGQKEAILKKRKKHYQLTNKELVEIYSPYPDAQLRKIFGFNDRQIKAIREKKVLYPDPSTYTDMELSEDFGFDKKQIKEIRKKGWGDLYQKKRLETETLSAAKEPKTSTPLERKFPKHSLQTEYYSKGGEVKKPSSFFKDEEIVMHHPAVRSKVLTEGQDRLTVDYSETGKAIIQQHGTRGGVSAAAAMLIADNRGKINIAQVIAQDNWGDITDEFKKVDLTPVKTQILRNETNRLQKIAELISKNGSVMMMVQGGHGLQQIIVDEISSDLKNVRLRDPYHGWEITVSSEAFDKTIPPSLQLEIIQVSKPK